MDRDDQSKIPFGRRRDDAEPTSASEASHFTPGNPDWFPEGQAEHSTWEVAAQMRGVIAAAVDGMIAIDERGRIEWINPAAERIFGYRQEELIGKNINVLMPEAYHGQHGQYLRNYLETGQTKIMGSGREVKGLRKDGGVFPMDLGVSEVKVGGEKMFTGIVRDITQRKEAERSLVEAKDAAEKANRFKDAFLAMVSHELRTPLNPIMAAVSLLQSKKDLDPEVGEEIISIRRNVEQEAHLVDDLINFSQLARGQAALHHEVVDVHALIHRLASQFEREADVKGIELALLLQAQHFSIWADPNRISQVLTNLLRNAIKFTPQGGRVTLRSLDAADGWCQIEISDTGIGIAPEVLGRLFNAFEQGEQTITRRFGGLGLGLAISKSIVELHGGKLLARSEGTDQGSTFVLELGTVPPVPEEMNHQDILTANRHHCRILLVEDHQDTRRVMVKLLKSLGYSVTAATGVRDALRLEEEEPFDVLVSDIGLPDGSGLDIIRQIKRHHAIKGIAVSGFGQPEDLNRSREAGFLDHLIKPLNFNRLERVLEEITA